MKNNFCKSLQIPITFIISLILVEVLVSNSSNKYSAFIKFPFEIEEIEKNNKGIDLGILLQK